VRVDGEADVVRRRAVGDGCESSSVADERCRRAPVPKEGALQESPFRVERMASVRTRQEVAFERGMAAGEQRPSAPERSAIGAER